MIIGNPITLGGGSGGGGGGELLGEIINSAGSCFGDTGGAATDTLTVELSGDVGELAVLVLMHRDVVTLDVGMTLVDSTANSYGQYISVYTKVMTSSVETVTVTQASSVRMCALTMYMRAGTAIGAPVPQEMDAGSNTYQYTIDRSDGPSLVVINDAYTVSSSSSLSHTITGEAESLQPDISTTAGIRLAAFVVQEGSGSVVWTESTTADADSRLYNRAFIYPLSGTASAFNGEVMRSGRLVRQSSRTLTANGTYDTTENDEVVAAVPISLATLVAHDNGVVTAPTGYDGIGQLTVAVNGANSGTVDLDDVFYYAADFGTYAPVVTTGTYTSGNHAVYAA